jgi:hypothetical protein
LAQQECYLAFLLCITQWWSRFATFVNTKLHSSLDSFLLLGLLQQELLAHTCYLVEMWWFLSMLPIDHLLWQSSILNEEHNDPSQFPWSNLLLLHYILPYLLQQVLCWEATRFKQFLLFLNRFVVSATSWINIIVEIANQLFH